MRFDKSTAGHALGPCGRCMPCRLNYQREWSLRMMHEKKFHDESVFVTLTYNDDHLPDGQNLSVRDVQLFLKRLRKAVYPRKIRHYIGGEYGDRVDRPHYHGIIFGMSARERPVLESAWGNGFVYCGTVTDDSCTYVAKYVTKKLMGQDALHYELAEVEPEFSVMSKRPGIGGDYAKAFLGEMRDRGYVFRKGLKAPLPRFYRSKIDATDEGHAVLEQRRVEYDTNHRRERGDSIAKLGFSKVDGIEILRRQGTVNNIVGKSRQKRGTL